MNQLKINLYFFGFSLLLFAAHDAIITKWMSTPDLSVFVEKTHIFLFVITFAIVNSLLLLHKKNPVYTGFVYLGSVLIKMALSVFYLYPHISKKPDNLKTLVVSFFIVFFLYLTAEVVILLKVIKKSEQ